MDLIDEHPTKSLSLRLYFKKNFCVQIQPELENQWAEKNALCSKHYREITKYGVELRREGYSWQFNLAGRKYPWR